MDFSTFRRLQFYELGHQICKTQRNLNINEDLLYILRVFILSQGGPQFLSAQFPFRIEHPSAHMIRSLANSIIDWRSSILAGASEIQSFNAKPDKTVFDGCSAWSKKSGFDPEAPWGMLDWPNDPFHFHFKLFIHGGPINLNLLYRGPCQKLTKLIVRC